MDKQKHWDKIMKDKRRFENKLSLVLWTFVGTLFLCWNIFPHSKATTEPEPHDAVVIDIKSMLDEDSWEEIVTVKNMNDNKLFAEEIIQGLKLVSENNGTLTRTYRIRKKPQTDIIDIEKLKEKIVEERLKLSALMHNASSIMSESEADAMKADCQRLHLYAQNGDLQGALEGTEELIRQIEQRMPSD